MSHPPNDWEQWMKDVSKQLKRFHISTQHLNEKSILIDQWLQTFYQLIDAIQSADQADDGMMRLSSTDEDSVLDEMIELMQHQHSYDEDNH